MELQDRLGKLFAGVSVGEALDNYLDRQSSVGARSGEEHKNEFLAIIELMFLMAAVDGQVAEEEVKQLQASLEALADIQGIEGLDVDDTLSELGARLDRDGWRARVQAAARRLTSDDARSFAFRLSVGVAFVDNFVASAEAAAIDVVAEALDLSRDDALLIMREVSEVLVAHPPST